MAGTAGTVGSPRKRFDRLLTGAFVLSLIAGGWWLRCGPLPPGLLATETHPSMLVLDRNGERLYESRSASGLRSDELDAAQLPAALVHATLAAEDVRFRLHPGIDPIAVARATFRNLREGRVREGGSTITQQVVKLLVARQTGVARRGWVAKLDEAVLALRLEHRLTKNEILAMYLNLAPYGNQIQGAGRASTAYFGRAAGTLTPAEAAFIAALPQQPTRFDPWRSAEKARPRQQRVLATMASRGWLSAGDWAAARTEQVQLQRSASSLIAPHFVERVLEAVGEDRPRRIRTTLDAGLQRTVTGIIAAERPSLARHHASNVAVAVLDNRTGDWLAWEGFGDYADADHGGRIDGVVQPRQPGSALKPFTYAAAFEQGASPVLALADVPSQFPTAMDGVLYSPRNYDGLFRGPLLVRSALAGSENVPAVALASKVGVPAIARLLRRAGFSTLDKNASHYGLGLTLGNAEVRLDEIVAAYAMLARGGESVAPRFILQADDAGASRAPAATRVLSERTAFWITDILADADARAFVFGSGGSLDFPFPVSAKTGTSQSYYDNWVIGYTRDVTVGVWVGNFDRTPLRGSSGVTGAGPIFHAVMLAAVERVKGSLPVGSTEPVLPPPTDVHRVEICAMSGLAAGDACPTRALEWTSADRTLESCTWHHATDEGPITVWPDEYRDWARANGRLAARRADEDLHPHEVVPVKTSSNSGIRALTIVRPLAGAVYLIDPTLRSEYQALTFRTRGISAGTLEWFVDDRTIGHVAWDEDLRWVLTRGRHQIVVKDNQGRTADTWIDVR